MRSGRKPEGERGFALLFVFLMAASIAIMFYMELPRAAFESQRVKEGMLVERGEQYARAIRLYVRKWNKYPANLEELEDTNGVRYLRRRYRDPMTGKEEWRLIHVGPGGVFTDSLIYDKAQKVQGVDSDKDKSEGKDSKSGTPAATASTFITGGPAFGSTDPLPGTQAESGSRFRKKRAWEREKKMPSEEGSTADTADAAQPSGQPSSGTTATATNTPQPVADQQNVGGMPTPFPTMTGAPPAGTGMTPTASNQALSMIQRLLTTPRAGGLAGIQAGGTQIGGGLAGVASKAEEEGIKVYNEKSAYNEWEFVYDVRKDAAKATSGMTGQQGTRTGTGSGITSGTSSPFGGLPGQGR
ncbi:MAG: hypothetical protein LLG20_03695 [Acidobacteriales bacterium]|nr:hypothetical protein [Terriglobales bacterium]